MDGHVLAADILRDAKRGELIQIHLLNRPYNTNVIKDEYSFLVFEESGVRIPSEILSEIDSWWFVE